MVCANERLPRMGGSATFEPCYLATGFPPNTSLVISPSTPFGPLAKICPVASSANASNLFGDTCNSGARADGVGESDAVAGSRRRRVH